jgi:hypothetical protein
MLAGLSSNTLVDLKPLYPTALTCHKSSCCHSHFVALFVLVLLWALAYITVAVTLETLDLFLSGAFFDVFDVCFLLISIFFLIITILPFLISTGWLWYISR